MSPLAKGETVMLLVHGAQNDSSGPDDAATGVRCTNLSSENEVKVRVEFFNGSGDFVRDSADHSVAPEEDHYYASQAILLLAGEWVGGDFEQVNPMTGRVVVIGGKANVLCSAQLWIHPASSSPTIVALPSLPLGKLKVKFK